jgi:serine/threonine protein kinase
MDDFHKQTTLPDQKPQTRKLPIPSEIGPYKIESILNRGGMSVLFLGVHPETQEPIAIKVLLPKFLKNKEIVNRFLKEAQIIETANHPNIVRLYGQGQWEKGLYIAMEFIRGVSLRQFIQQKSFTQRKALEIVLQVAYALCHLHTHGIIHRDLKPENILITENGDIKVIDFGIAQFHNDLDQERITQRKKLMGTPVYMSPEQRENPLHITFATDIYSLGIIAYELLLGRLSHGVIHLALLPRALRTIIEKALQATPSHRYKDIVEFITDISEYLSQAQPQEETSEELLETIDHTRAQLLPKNPPAWPQFEIGIASQNTLGTYLDFFHLSDNRYCLFLAESLDTTPAALFHASTLRGMVKIAIHHSHPLSALQQALDIPFSLSYLLLRPDKDLLTYTSCKSGTLWHIPENSLKIRSLATPNPPLGTSPSPLLETSDNFLPGDRLILHSSTLPDLSPPEEHLSPTHQAQQILEQLSTAKRGGVVIVIRRTY